MKSDSNKYAQAGVDINAGYRAVELMKSHVQRTRTPGVLSGLGGFGGLFAPDLRGMEKPVLVSGTDGVGTKLKLAFLMDRHDTIGIDCVAMCVNDVLCSGAQPLFFLDYVAVGKNVPERVAQIVAGVAEGCVQAGCALIGGETAEMPGMYPAGEYDLAGFAVGAVEKSDLIDGSKIVPGDVVLGLASSGAHSNGYSLIRKIIELARPDLDADFHGRTLREVVMEPTRIYVKPLLSLMRSMPGAVKGMAHITGGGITENVPRILRDELTARIDAASWTLPPLFQWLHRAGNVDMQEMYRVFNCGIGMAVVVSAEDADLAAARLEAAGETVYRIGRIDARADGEAQTIVG